MVMKFYVVFKAVHARKSSCWYFRVIRLSAFGFRGRVDSGSLSFSRKALVPSLDLSAFRAALDCCGAGNDPFFLETTDGSTGG